MYVTYGLLTFDYHGYMIREKTLVAILERSTRSLLWMASQYWKDWLSVTLHDCDQQTQTTWTGSVFWRSSPRTQQTSSNRRNCLSSCAIRFEIARVPLRPKLSLFLGRLWFALSSFEAWRILGRFSDARLVAHCQGRLIVSICSSYGVFIRPSRSRGPFTTRHLAEVSIVN